MSGIARSQVFAGREQDTAPTPRARVCGVRYSPLGYEAVTGIRWYCNRLPDHAGPHDGDMGPHVIKTETRQTWMLQECAVCTCGWRGLFSEVSAEVRTDARWHRVEYER